MKHLKEILEDKSIDEKEKYHQYVNKSFEWQIIRKIILERDGYKCCCCGRTEKDKISGKYVNLTIHHNTYKHLFNESQHLNDLITLCQLCHNAIHKHPGNYQRFKQNK